MTPPVMDVPTAAAIAAALVVPLVQLAKWAGWPGQRAPLLVLLLSAVGTALYRASTAVPLVWGDAWLLPVTWVGVATIAAGLFGFTRALPEALTATRQPPPGAGADPAARM